MLDIFPLDILGLSSPQTTSKGFGIQMFSLEIVKLSNLTAIAAPPPLRAPGWGETIGLETIGLERNGLIEI